METRAPLSSKQLATHVTGSGVGRATRFELASRGQSDAANIDDALERNRTFAAASGHRGAVLFPNLRLFVITCLDPRVDPAQFLGLRLATPWSSATSADESPPR